MSRAPVDRCRMLYLVGGPGNAERVDVTELFAKHLASEEFVVDYVIFGLNGTSPWQAIEWRGARAWTVGRSPRGGLIGAVISKLYEVHADWRTFWKALTGDYQIIQIRDKFVVGVLALLAARLRGRKFTYWMSYPFAECRIVDGREGNSQFPLASILGGRAAMFLLYRIILPFADHVFVQSEQMKADVAEHGIEPDTMTSVPMAVSETLLEHRPQTIEPGSILYLGTLIRVRRLDTLLEAMEIVLQRHPEAKLVFVGEGDSPDDRAYLEARTAELNLIDSVVFTGRVPMEQAHDYVSRAAVCLSPFYPIPILLSTSPTKISEYMALGRPVVANEHPEQSLIIAESRAGHCVEWSASAFAEAILDLLDDPVQADAMGERGREWVRQHRIYSVVAPRVAQTYRTLLGVSSNG